MMEQRYRAVLEGEAGVPVTEVALARFKARKAEAPRKLHG